MRTSIVVRRYHEELLSGGVRTLQASTSQLPHARL
jgi:hypothetical protein